MMSKMISIKKYFILVIGLLFITGCNNGLAILEKKGSINDDSSFEFKKSPSIVDTYMLNTKEDQNEYFVKNLVEATGFIPISSVDITVNNELLFDLSEMFTKEAYKELILRRGYVECEDNSSNCVVDHRTGYDVDFYIKNHEWTDFIGHEEADDLIKNSYKYGLVLRYPNKEDYQPWHYRYIGKTHAMIMNDEGLTLEQYIEKLNKLDSNKIYKIKNTTQYMYKVNKKDVVVPDNYNYSISSISDDYYIINFDTNKTVVLKEVENQEKLVDKRLNDLNILYDLVLVNNENSVPENINVEMVSLTKYLTDDNNSEYVLSETVLQNLKPMLEEANDLDRHVTYLTSAYRTKEDQQELYESGEEGYVQKPDYSEHQTGLAFDLSNSYKSHIEFTTTAQGFWIQNNAHKYGFINRYPIDKIEITNISYEPWHFRYVGELHATYMNENNLALEEYIDTFKLGKFYQMKFNNNEYLLYKTTVKKELIETYENVNDIYLLRNNEYLVIYEDK